MFGLFNMFGRSTALRALDEELRASGVHPLLVPEAVKLMMLRLHKQAGAGTGRAWPEPDLGKAAQLFAYCMLGRESFLEKASMSAANQAEDRLKAAMDSGDSYDAGLVLLALHSGLIAPDIAERIEIEDR